MYLCTLPRQVADLRDLSPIRRSPYFQHLALRSVLYLKKNKIPDRIFCLQILRSVRTFRPLSIATLLHSQSHSYSSTGPSCLSLLCLSLISGHHATYTRSWSLPQPTSHSSQLLPPSTKSLLLLFSERGHIPSPSCSHLSFLLLIQVS